MSQSFVAGDTLHGDEGDLAPTRPPTWKTRTILEIRIEREVEYIELVDIVAVQQFGMPQQYIRRQLSPFIGSIICNPSFHSLDTIRAGRLKLHSPGKSHEMTISADKKWGGCENLPLETDAGGSCLKSRVV